MRKKNVRSWKLTEDVILSIMHNTNNQNYAIWRLLYFSKHLIQMNVDEKIMHFELFLNVKMRLLKKVN
jgi:hypothetical protein